MVEQAARSACSSPATWNLSSVSLQPHPPKPNQPHCICTAFSPLLAPLATILLSQALCLTSPSPSLFPSPLTRVVLEEEAKAREYVAVRRRDGHPMTAQPLLPQQPPEGAGGRGKEAVRAGLRHLADKEACELLLRGWDEEAWEGQGGLWSGRWRINARQHCYPIETLTSRRLKCTTMKHTMYFPPCPHLSFPLSPPPLPFSVSLPSHLHHDEPDHREGEEHKEHRPQVKQDDAERQLAACATWQRGT